jgi:hypothetical protein
MMRLAWNILGQEEGESGTEMESPIEPVWAVCMVRNDGDILPYTIAHLIYEGVSGFVIADNLSDDETPDILEMFKAISSVPVHIIQDTTLAFDQGKKMTHLANVAFDLGASYVVPFDADELWYSYDPKMNLCDLVRSTKADAIGVPLWNHKRTRLDPPIPNPILSMCYRKVTANAPEFAKVIVRWKPGYALRDGNHSVAYPDGITIAGPATMIGIRHFPFRSPRQFLKRIKDSMQAYRFTKLNKIDHVHKRVYASEIYFMGEEHALKTYESWILENPDAPDSGVVCDPAPLYGRRPPCESGQ